MCVCVCPLRVCTRRARRARTFTSDETAVELPAASLGSVTRPVFVSAEVGPSLSTPAVDSLESGLEVVGMCFGLPPPRRPVPQISIAWSRFHISTLKNLVEETQNSS